MTYQINISGHDDLTGDAKADYENGLIEKAKALVAELSDADGGRVTLATAHTNTTGSVNLLAQVATSPPREANLGFFGPFMRAWGQASPEARAALYMDTQAYTYGRETSATLYAQVYDLLGVSPGRVQVKVAALYVETGGAYFGLPDVDPWDEARDARLYEGPWPVVAHPPCQRWCRLAKQVEWRGLGRVGDDGGTFAAALAAVRRFGGVLEHPAGSLAWKRYDLPEPRSTGGWTTSLLDGGASCYVEQGRYGHLARKATWLYAYGCELPNLRWGRRIDSEAGEYKWGSDKLKGAAMYDRPRVPTSQRAATPAAFREALLTMARSALPSLEILAPPHNYSRQTAAAG